MDTKSGPLIKAITSCPRKRRVESADNDDSFGSWIRSVGPSGFCGPLASLKSLLHIVKPPGSRL